MDIDKTEIEPNDILYISPNCSLALRVGVGLYCLPYFCGLIAGVFFFCSGLVDGSLGAGFFGSLLILFSFLFLPSESSNHLCGHFKIFAQGISLPGFHKHPFSRCNKVWGRSTLLFEWEQALRFIPWEKIEFFWFQARGKRKYLDLYVKILESNSNQYIMTRVSYTHCKKTDALDSLVQALKEHGVKSGLRKQLGY